MGAELQAAVRLAAKREGLTVSKFIETAIREGLARIEAAEYAATRVPKRAQFVIAGWLKWPLDKYNAARKAGRIFDVHPTKEQSALIYDAATGWLPFRKFLSLATNEQLNAMRGAAVLDRVEILHGEPQVYYTMFRGRGPGGSVDEKAKRRRRHVAAELRRRGILNQSEVAQ